VPAGAQTRGAGPNGVHVSQDVACNSSCRHDRLARHGRLGRTRRRQRLSESIGGRRRQEVWLSTSDGGGIHTGCEEVPSGCLCLHLAIDVVSPSLHAPYETRPPPSSLRAPVSARACDPSTSSRRAPHRRVYSRSAELGSRYEAAVQTLPNALHNGSRRKTRTRSTGSRRSSGRVCVASIN